MTSPEVTRADVEDFTRRVYEDIASGNKAAAIGTLFQLSPSSSLFWKQHADVNDEEIRTLHETLMDIVSKIAAMDGEMDDCDTYLYNEGLDHVRMSFEERGYTDLLDRLRKGEDRMNNKKMQALEVFKDICQRYTDKYRQEMRGKNLPAVLKEIWSLAADVEKTEGALDPESEKIFENLRGSWRLIQDREDVTDEQVAAAQLPYKTATGRETALPVFKTRFDA